LHLASTTQLPLTTTAHPPTPTHKIESGNNGDAVLGAAVAGLVVSCDILTAGDAAAGDAGAAAVHPATEWAGVFDPSRLRGLLGSLGSLCDLATEIGCDGGLWGWGLGQGF